ncbi:hypothetical protein C8J57DRAFT_1229842 [Mycena rebaudengoi]|nr:hypothetical protein C8J57DRAFT_1229842 [Mycena rebaudengoi]
MCAFADGQTRRGKNWTDGGRGVCRVDDVFGTPEMLGIIPRAVTQLFCVAEERKDKVWVYTFETRSENGGQSPWCWACPRSRRTYVVVPSLRYSTKSEYRLLRAGTWNRMAPP